MRPLLDTIAACRASTGPFPGARLGLALAVGALAWSGPIVARGEVATGQPAVEAIDIDARKRALEEVEHRFNRAAGARDREAFHRLLAEDAVFLAGELHRGRLAVMAIWQHLFAGKFDFRYDAELLEATVAESGELGWAVGTVRTRFQRPGVAEAEGTDGHYLNLWRHDPDRGWQLIYAASLVVHPTLGAGRDPRSGLMTAWPELAEGIDAEIAIRWRPEVTLRAASGELAFSFGGYRASFTPPADPAKETGEAPEDGEIAGDGHYLAVWQRDGSGRWQLAAEGLTPPGIYAE